MENNVTDSNVVNLLRRTVVIVSLMQFVRILEHVYFACMESHHIS